jgi:hypothetical protein
LIPCSEIPDNVREDRCILAYTLHPSLWGGHVKVAHIIADVKQHEATTGCDQEKIHFPKDALRYLLLQSHHLPVFYSGFEFMHGLK